MWDRASHALLADANLPGGNVAGSFMFGSRSGLGETLEYAIKPDRRSWIEGAWDEDATVEPTLGVFIVLGGALAIGEGWLLGRPVWALGAAPATVCTAVDAGAFGGCPRSLADRRAAAVSRRGTHHGGRRSASEGRAGGDEPGTSSVRAIDRCSNPSQADELVRIQGDRHLAGAAPRPRPAQPLRGAAAPNVNGSLRRAGSRHQSPSAVQRCARLADKHQASMVGRPPEASSVRRRQADERKENPQPTSPPTKRKYAMTATAMHQQKNVTTTSDFVCSTITWDQINEPGAYICNWSGHLLRVPEDGVTPGRSPLLSMVGPEPLFVTKISNNPYVTVTKAKLIASNFDLNVNF